MIISGSRLKTIISLIMVFALIASLSACGGGSKYNEGLALLEDGNYSDGKALLLEIGKFDIEDDKIYDALRKGALKKISEGEFKNGRSILEEIDAYDPDDEDVLEAMYQYVKSDTNANKFLYSWETDVRYDYLLKLKQVNYEDSVEIYNDLYAWKIDVRAITNQKDYSGTISETTLSYNDDIYFYFDLKGGPPDGKTSLKVYATWDSDPEEPLMICDCPEATKGYEFWPSCHWKNPKAIGKLTFEVFDGEGNMIGSAFVNIA